MTEEQKAQRADIHKATSVFVDVANELAKHGAHPIVISEPAMCATLEMSRAILGPGALVSWLRDAADHIEAALLAEAQPVRFD